MVSCKKITAVLMSVVLFSLSVFTFVAYASTADLRYFERGVLTDGTHTAYYIIDKDNKTIYLTGDGVTNAQTPDYPNADSGPFSGRTDITKVVIEEDVARVGDYVFANLKSVDTLEIQSNLLSSSSSMSSKSMSGCTGLRNVQADSSLISTNVLLEVIKGALNIISGNWLSLISNGISIGKTGINGDGSLPNEVVHAMVNDYIMTGEEVFLGDLDAAVQACQEREQEPCYWANAYHHEYTSVVSSFPSCTADGERAYTCSVCGSIYFEHFGSPLGHDYVYDTLYENSCTKEGISKGVCSRCSDVKFVSIPAKGHTDGYWEMTSIPTETESGSIKCLCLDCNEVLRSVNVSVKNTTYRKYKVNLNPSENSVEDVLASLKQIGYSVSAVKDDRLMTDSEKVGTGCRLYICHAAGRQVYEIDTVILYGDVDGDGIIGNDDYDILNDYVMGNSGLLSDGSVSRRAADLNNDNVIDAFDLALLDLQVSGGKSIDQSKPQY